MMNQVTQYIDEALPSNFVPFTNNSQGNIDIMENH